MKEMIHIKVSGDTRSKMIQKASQEINTALSGHRRLFKNGKDRIRLKTYAREHREIKLTYEILWNEPV